MGAKSAKLLRREASTLGDDDEALVLVRGDALHCPVCYTVFSGAPLLLPCGHSYCRPCLSRMTRRGAGECALCRQVFFCRLTDLPRNFALEALVDSVRALPPRLDADEDGAPRLCADASLRLANELLVADVAEARADAARVRLALRAADKRLRVVVGVAGALLAAAVLFCLR